MSAVHGVGYPFGAPAQPGVLRADGSWVDTVPARTWPGRTAMVAVGSNAVPAVVHAKLTAATASASASGGMDVPFVPSRVHGIGIAHSAHVSPGGYVPTTPFVEPGRVLTLVVSWFTDEQLAAIDQTEPNYVRRRTPPGAAGTAQLYVSRWGVLAPGGEPLRPTTQAEIHRLLAGDVELSALLPFPDSERVVDALSDPRLRDRVRERLAARGWVVPTGFG